MSVSSRNGLPVVRTRTNLVLLMTLNMLLASSQLSADSLLAGGELSFDKPNFQTAAPVPIEPTPPSVFGNYAGAGKCVPTSPKPCTDTGVLDNVFIQPLAKPETDEERQIRELAGNKKADAQVAIRILRDYGHSCTLEGKMFWSKDHLEFKDRPPAARSAYIRCDLQLWPKDGDLVIKDPLNACAKKFCFSGKPAILADRRFQKGKDQLLAAYKKSATPPPTSLFGTYNGTGKCPTDERKTSFCIENKLTDLIVIKPSETADARVVFEDPSCRMDDDAMWLGNHLAIMEQRPDNPGSPYLLQFWFKDDTVAVTGVEWSHCATGYFKKSSTPPSSDTKR